MEGDPFCPLLFSITLQDVLIKLVQHISETKLLVFYLYDGVIVAEKETFRRKFDVSEAQKAKKAGLYLGMTKGRV